MESLGLSGRWRLAIWGGRSYYKYIARLPGVGAGRGMEEDPLFSQSFFRGGEGESHNTALTCVVQWFIQYSSLNCHDPHELQCTVKCLPCYMTLLDYICCNMLYLFLNNS